MRFYFQIFGGERRCVFLKIQCDVIIKHLWKEINSDASAIYAIDDFWRNSITQGVRASTWTVNITSKEVSLFLTFFICCTLVHSYFRRLAWFLQVEWCILLNEVQALIVIINLVYYWSFGRVFIIRQRGIFDFATSCSCLLIQLSYGNHKKKIVGKMSRI